MRRGKNTEEEIYADSDGLDYETRTVWGDEKRKLILPENGALVCVPSKDGPCIGCVFVNKYYDCVNSPLYCPRGHIYKVRLC